jgi:ADP-ribose pyrophosphatase
MNWQIKSSKHIVKDKWISLRSDECIMPNGKTIEPYYVLEYSDWINVVPITKNNEIIMIKQYRHGIKDVLLELPSGSIEPFDKSPLEAAKRELLEETGAESDNFIQLCKLSPNPSNHTNITYSFLALDVTLKQNQNLDETEQIEIINIPILEVKSLLKNNKITQAMHVSALFYAFEYLNESSTHSV